MAGASFFAFAGPAYLVTVGYMDPGNWATDIAGGSRFGYRLHLGAADEQPDGGAAADAVGAARASSPAGTSRRPAATATPAGPLVALCPLRDRHRRLRPRRGAGHRHRPAPAPSSAARIPLVWAVLITGARRLPAAGDPARGHPQMEAFILVAGRDHRRLLRRRDLPAQARLGAASPTGFVPVAARSRAMLYIADRHPRRDGDAAQPLSPLGARAVPRRAAHAGGHRARRAATTSSTRSIALNGALLRQRRHPGRRRRDVLRRAASQVTEIQEAHALLDAAARHQARRRSPSRSR